MIRNNPVWFVLFLTLIPVYGLGALLLFVWWIKVMGIKLTITDEKVTLRHGILSKNLNEVYLGDIRNVIVNQSFFDRVFKSGSVGISTAGQGNIEIQIQGIPHPNKVKSIIDKQRKKTPINDRI